MLDDLNTGSSRDGREGHKEVPARHRRDRDREVRSVVEREVPLGQQSDHTLSPAVHSWLDGELPEAAVRKGDTAHDVEFWRTVNSQMERARRMRTPVHVEAQIMASLPHHAPQLITPWYQREFVIKPSAAVAVAIALIAITAAATVAFLAP
ncbi:MAG: hypothetical protein ACREOK_06685 [Gemmatimonadaceae bacterium]